ncbi:hypothetical protein ACEWY4_017390 [Coilia grayii]|uniref:Immunoglobulin V-set domain-containing protein n=1 Tax=Coilia grayii TaxID=363190 RepID=A0ABD1JJJ0_9TELE
MVESDNHSMTHERFSLYDNPSEDNFMVLITQLTAEDSGTYKCVLKEGHYGNSTSYNLKLNVTTEQTQKRRIQVLPSGSVSVTVDQLNDTDAGEYWCGVEAAVRESITLISKTHLVIGQDVSVDVGPPAGAPLWIPIIIFIIIISSSSILITYVCRTKSKG